MSPPAALSVYIHWPYCARICPYCDFNVFRARGRRDEAVRLVHAIVADMEAQAARIGPRTLGSVFFGGGTPSLMDPAWVAEILAAALRLWAPLDDLEVTLEANPTDAEADRFAALASAGVNRLSLGLQSLDDAALKALGRNHDAAEALRAAAIATRAFRRLSLDMIYARPGQSEAAWRIELQAILDLGAEHLSPYQLTIEPGAAFGRAVRRGLLTPLDEDLSATLYEVTQDRLEAAGYEAYEVSNHARGPEARSRHNLAYWQGGDYLGVGPGAHGRLMLNGARTATVTKAAPAGYIAAVETAGVGFAAFETLSPVAVAEERLLTGLRITPGLAFDEVAVLGLNASHRLVRRLVALDLLAADPQHLRATPSGRRVLDSLTRTLILDRDD